MLGRFLDIGSSSSKQRNKTEMKNDTLQKKYGVRLSDETLNKLQVDLRAKTTAKKQENR